MSPSALNRSLRRRRRHLALVFAVVCLGGLVAVHHLPADEMAMAGAAAMCAAIVPLVATATAAATGLLGLPRMVRLAAPLGARDAVAPPLPRARSSPDRTVVLRL